MYIRARRHQRNYRLYACYLLLLHSFIVKLNDKIIKFMFALNLFDDK